MQALQSALGRIAALETEVSSQKTRAEAVEGQVAVQRAALDQAEKLLTAAAAAEQQQRTQIGSLTDTLKQQLATQAELGTAMQAILARGAGGAASASTALIDTRLLGKPQHFSGDTDADGDTLSITSVRTGSTEGSGSQANISSGGSNTLTGTYGQITVYSDGRWTYTANQTQADYLDKGDSATEYFNYTVSDGTDTDYGTITINLTGINDEIVAVNDTDSVTEGNTITRSATHANALDRDDTDLDANDTYSNHLITAIRTGSTEGSGTGGSISSGSSRNVTGTYGTLTVYSTGAYSYAATTDAATALGSGDVVYDYVTDTVQDQSKSGTYDTDTATLTITVTGTNAAPVANNGYWQRQ